jgi:hypothetical protein
MKKLANALFAATVIFGVDFLIYLGVKNAWDVHDDHAMMAVILANAVFVSLLAIAGSRRKSKGETP